MKIGALITLPPDHRDFPGFLERLRQDQAEGHRLYLYCLDDGIACLRHAPLQQLRADGASLFACAYAALQRMIPLDDSATFAGLGTLANVITDTDQFRTL